MTILGFLQYLTPQSIITHVGIPGVALVAFLETALIFGFFLPGDSLMFLTGLNSSAGFFSLPLRGMWLVLSLACVLGNYMGYRAGRYSGDALLHKYPKLISPKYITKAKKFYQDYGKTALVLGRFMPIVRTFVPYLAGVTRMDQKTFMLYNIIGAFLWCGMFLLIGHYLGGYFPGLKSKTDIIAVVFVLITTVPVIIKGVLKRK